MFLSPKEETILRIKSEVTSIPKRRSSFYFMFFHLMQPRSQSSLSLSLFVVLLRFCEEVFHGPVSIQEQWITHLQKHILSLGYKGKASPPAAPTVAAPALVHPVAV